MSVISTGYWHILYSLTRQNNYQRNKIMQDFMLLAQKLDNRQHEIK